MKLAAISAAAILFATGATAGPAVTTNVADLSIDQNACMTLAARVVRGADLTEKFQVSTQSVFGEKGGYTGAIRCIAVRKVVVFIVAGPDSKEAAPLSKRLLDDFEAGQKRR